MLLQYMQRLCFSKLAVTTVFDMLATQAHSKHGADCFTSADKRATSSSQQLQLHAHEVGDRVTHRPDAFPRNDTGSDGDEVQLGRCHAPVRPGQHYSRSQAHVYGQPAGSINSSLVIFAERHYRLPGLSIS